MGQPVQEFRVSFLSKSTSLPPMLQALGRPCIPLVSETACILSRAVPATPAHAWQTLGQSPWELARSYRPLPAEDGLLSPVALCLYLSIDNSQSKYNR